MATILFVHGTGVRRGSYLTTYACVKRELERHHIDHALAPCLWGDVLGASPVVKSVPDVRIENPSTALTRDQDYARWDLLYRDPLFELRLFRNRPLGGPRPPSTATQNADLWARITVYVPTDAMRERLRETGLGDYWTAAWQRIVGHETTRHAVASAAEIGEPAQAVAAAIVAEVLGAAFDAEGPLPDSRQRDGLVAQLVDDWEARVAGVGAYILGFVADMASTISTPIVRWRRGDISQNANPVAGDILRYQARGQDIRNHIHKSITDLKGDVYLLAHSLGGIACVDLLATAPIPQVKGLITVGSQASYLHEIGALSCVDPGAPLPSHFPRWLNLYDPYDFLSYVVAGIFADARDTRIESGQPFPQSHSAYWTNPETWAAIRAFLP